MKFEGRFLVLLLICAGTVTVAAQNYGWSTIAGAYNSGGSQDGTNHNALFRAPTGMAADGGGEVFVADAANYTIRKITAVGTNWVSTTIAGSAGFLGFADGTNNGARFYNDLRQMLIDGNGNLYVQEYNPSYPSGQPWLIREVRPIGTNWVVNTLYNNGSPGGWAVDVNGNFYTATNYTIIKLTPLVTNGLPSLTNFAVTSLAGTAGAPGTMDGTNSAARFNSPGVFAVNANGVIYLSDSTGIRTVAPSGSNWVVTTLPVVAYTYMSMDSQGNIAGTYPAGPTIQFLAAGAANWISIGGSNGVSGGTDGTNRAALFSNPAGIAVNGGGNLFATDTSADTIRQGVNPAVPLGSLQVSLGPTGAVASGAMWRVTAGAWQTNGATTTNLQAGAHILSFLPISGWTTPLNQVVTIGTNLTTTATGTYVQQFGSLQVVISPAGAASAGAAWQLDGGAWQSSGVVLSNISVGTHTVAFLPIPGWMTPSNQILSVLYNQTANFTATYVALGGVEVIITPAAAVSAGAQWQLDGGAWYASGLIVSNLVAGDHAIAFTNLPGWTTPSNQIATVSLNQTTVVTGAYMQQLGAVQAVLSPAGALSAGAQWQLDGGAGEPSGVTLNNVSIGAHTVSFSIVAGWISPTNQPIAVNSNQTVRITGVYEQQSGLQVTLSPPGATSSGAAWQLDDGAWLATGTTVSGLTPGIHNIAFKPAAGWVAPASQSLAIPAGQITTTNEFYAALNYVFSTIAGTAGDAGYADGTSNLALFDNPASIAAAGALYIADTGNSVIRELETNGSGNWFSMTLAGLAGNTGHADGTNRQARFDFPSGVALGVDGSVFVADQVSATIRRMAFSVASNAWMVTTIAGQAGSYGSADGTNSDARFYYPAGLTVDGAGNVYVTDQINSTLRKIAPLGSNNWAVTTIAGTAGVTGSADGANSAATFYWPTGVAVDTNGCLYVADTFNDAIRKVTPVGTNYVVATICGTAGTNGAADGTNQSALFDGPNGIVVDATGNLYVADSFSSLIRKITPQGANWLVNTIGGLAYNPGNQNGTNSFARFDSPGGVCADANGTVYVADTDNQTIRMGVPVSLGSSPFALTATWQPGGMVGLSWNALLASTYQVQFKTNLLQSNWVNLGAAMTATNSPMLFVDTAASSQRYYRVVLVLQ